MRVRILPYEQKGYAAISIENYSNKIELYDILEHVRDIDGREYKPGHQIWTIPISNIDSLKRNLCRADISCITSCKVERKINKYKEWSEKQNVIKNKDYIELSILDVLLKKELLPFQTVGTSYLLHGKKTILADNVGLGKSVQAIAANEILFERGLIDKAIIVCPSTLKKKWAKEIVKFTNSTYLIIDGSRINRAEQYIDALNCDYRYIITNYHMLQNDSFIEDSKGLDEFEIFKNSIDSKRTSIVFDEIQYIKNGKAKRTMVSKELGNRLKYLFGLSATYIELGLEDVFWLFQTIEPGLFGSSYWMFADKHIVFNDYTGKVVGYKNSKIVKRKIKPYVIRRMKEEVMDQLPDRIEKTYWVNLSKPQQKIYKEVADNISKSIADKEKLTRIENATVLSRMGYLRQVCLSTELIGVEKIYSAKLDELKRIILEDIPKQKIIVFCFYKKMVEAISRELGFIGLNTLYMHSKHPKKKTDRWEMLEQFKKEDYDVLVTSDILREGHDLQFASILINFDLLWNPAKMEQRNGRIDRIGQESDSIVLINIVSNGTIEEYIWDKLEERKKLIDNIVNDNYVSSRLTVQTIREIING